MPRPTDDQTDGPVATGGPGDEPAPPAAGRSIDDALASIDEVMRSDDGA